VTLKTGLGPLKVIGTDTYRSATYDFLLTFHSNYGPTLYRFRDRRRFQSKIANFPHPRVFYAPADGVPLELGIGVRQSKTRARMLPGLTRSWTISSAVWIQSTNVTDGRTDRRTTAKTALTHSVERLKRLKL